MPNLLVNLLVAAVMMTTLVVGPFYLGLGLGLKEAPTGLVMSVGPVISILSGVPSGRAVDALGAEFSRLGWSCSPSERSRCRSCRRSSASPATSRRFSF